MTNARPGEACVLWCLAIRHAVLTGVLDVRIGLQHIDADRQDLWARRLDIAEASQPSDFKNNGWVVEALQGAWSAIATTPVPADDPASGVCRVNHLHLPIDAAPHTRTAAVALLDKMMSKFRELVSDPTQEPGPNRRRRGGRRNPV